MSFEKPILTMGNPSNQAISEVVSEPRHDIGTRAILPDGRAYYYACNRGSAIAAGVLLGGAQISVDFDDIATNTALVGDMVVNVTPVGTATYAANQLAGGYLSINSGTTGLGMQYRIASHPATTAATAFNVTLSEPIAVAFNADTTATVCPNIYSSVSLLDVSATRFAVGATAIPVAAGSTTPQYFWAQTWGQATVLADTAGDITGHAITAGAAGGTDGSYIGFVDAAADVPHIIGVNLFTSVADDFMPVILQIMP